MLIEFCKHAARLLRWRHAVHVQHLAYAASGERVARDAAAPQGTESLWDGTTDSARAACARVVVTARLLASLATTSCAAAVRLNTPQCSATHLPVCALYRTVAQFLSKIN